jgi:hypothetical protein
MAFPKKSYFFITVFNLLLFHQMAFIGVHISSFFRCGIEREREREISADVAGPIEHFFLLNVVLLFRQSLCGERRKSLKRKRKENIVRNNSRELGYNVYSYNNHGYNCKHFYNDVMVITELD